MKTRKFVPGNAIPTGKPSYDAPSRIKLMGGIDKIPL